MAGNIHIIRPTGDFLMVSKVVLRDKAVDPFTLGIYVRVLALGETDWELNIKGLATHFDMTEERIRKAFRVLEDAGYMSRQRVRDEKNRFIGWDYELYTAPENRESRNTENPDLGFFPTSGNPATNNNTKIEYQEINREDKKEKNNKRFDFRSALLSLGVSIETADTWLEVRRRRGAVNTELAFKYLCSEIAKTGQTAEECIRIAAANSWQGFKAEYLRPRNMVGSRPQPKQESVYEKNARAFAEFQQRLQNQFPDEQ